MPSKSVHFSEDNETYSYPPSPVPTPSPTFSSTTLSTSELATPPPTTAQLHSTYVYKPFSVADAPVTIRQALANAIALNIDISDIRTLSAQRSSLPPLLLAEPATVPPTSTFVIVCEHLPWTMTIHPSSQKLGAFVTISDVLYGLYSGLRLHVKEDEYRTESHQSRGYIRDAFSRRCALMGPRAKEEENKGLRRIDFLLGKHRVVGFSRADNKDAWRLTVSR